MEGLVNGEINTEFWRDRRVFVTGGAGLVGGWLVKRLLAAKADAVCLIRDWTPQSEIVRDGMFDKVTVVRGDVCDSALIERILGEYEIDTVIHLAAQTIVGIADRNPISTFESNIRGTWVLLEACRRSPLVKQIVVASSDKAYGEQAVLPYTESTPLAGVNPYDVSKSCADMIAASYASNFDLPVVITRCGNFYGGGDLNWNRLIPGTIRSILRGERPIIRSDGTYIRDYFYVEDGAAAYMLLAEKLAGDRTLAGEAFNFSNEIQVTVSDMTQRILHAMNSDLEPDIRDEAKNEIRHQYLSAEKARTRLGWKPLFDLETGIERTIKWYEELLGEDQAAQTQWNI